MAEAGLSFAGLLRQLRTEARLTQEELAEAAALSPRSISDLERGINRTARKDTAQLLAVALGLAGPVRELFVAAARGKAPAAEVLSARLVRLPRVLGAMDTPAANSGVAIHVFLFTDIEGSTSLVQRVGADVYARVLADHRELIRSALAGHGGREVNTAGDGFFAAFSSPGACVAAAMEMQQALADHEWPGGELVRVRMGVHCGEAEQTAAGPVGLDVHRAARIAAAAHGGQVLISEIAAALVRDGLPPGAGLMDLGVHRLKDLGRPERLFQLRGPGLAAEFPRLRSLGSPVLTNNLPAQLTVFIGREMELSEVGALAASSRLVTLTGPGGCGKTRLGLQVAAGRLDGWGDGVWLVELAAVTDQDAVPAAVAGALRIPAQSARPVLDALADALGPQEMLIVLDNCEHLVGGCAKTAETILQRCPKVHLIATSREPLAIAAERIYRVPSLSLPEAGDDDGATAISCDAVALLAERARAQGVALALDADAVSLAVSVCRRLDGMPLAIELAAARLRSMSLADLAGRLDQRFGLLTGGSRTALARQQTLRAAIGWSYSLLAPAEQLLLGRLSVFAAGFDLAAAETVCGFGMINAAEVAALLGSLADKSLVVAEPAGAGVRYRLLETIRLFAAERLAGTGGQEAAAARAGHCAHYLTVAETAAPHLTGAEQGAWLVRLETDDANFLRAAEHAAGQPDGAAQVLRFAVALLPHWLHRYQEAAALMVPVLRRPEAAADPAVFAEALFAASMLSEDVTTSLRLAEQMDRVAGELGDNRLLAMSRGRLAALYWARGELERAQPLGQEAVQRARELGDDVLLAKALMTCVLSTHPMVGSDATTAEELYAEAIACTERSGDLAINSVLHNNVGVYRLEIGDIAAARAHLEVSIATAEMIGRPSAYVVGSLAEVLFAEHDLDGARSAFEDALRLGRRIGEKRSTAEAILGLARLAADTGEWRRAATLHGAAQALVDQIGFVWDPGGAELRQESLDLIAAALGDDQLRQAYTQGAALSFDHAIDLALGKSSPL